MYRLRIAMARALARFDPRWFEEPVPPESIDALADVRANSPIPIAAGERYFEPERFLELIYEKAVDILQPDVGHVGGCWKRRKSPPWHMPASFLSRRITRPGQS